MTFRHGDYPTAASLNALGSGLAAAHEGLGDAPANFLYPYVSEATFTLVHVQRYLFYRSSGKLLDPSGAHEEIALSETGEGYGVLDLDDVGWLTPGMRYTVTGVSVAVESYEP